MMPYNCDYSCAKKSILLLVFASVIGLVYLLATRYNPQLKTVVNMTGQTPAPQVVVADPKAPKFLKQRNELSRQLNQMKQAYGQQSCEQLKLQQASGKQVETKVSENGGWCAESSGENSKNHMWDKGFSTAISAFFQGKAVASFGDGPGSYKKHMDTLKQVKSYTAYDGAPFCEKTTNGVVKFLDLTAPQFGLEAYDWVISVEVGEHIPGKYEDIYLDNIARHAREGIVLSWAVPGQGGLSHVNNKALVDVIAQMNKRGFDIDKPAGEPLRTAASFSWLRANVHVYKRISPLTFVEEDV